MNGERSRIAFIGDVHLEPDDPDLRAFTSMLDAVAEECDTLVLMGDLFNLWIGQPDLQQAHQIEVGRTLRGIRARGVEVHYIEGNRDYFIGRAYRGDLFDTAGDQGLGLRVRDRSLWAIHGDLTNPSDWQYRLWRGLSRSAFFWWCFNRLPAQRRLRVAQRLEARMRATNRAFKREFPRGRVEAYAAGFAARGHDAIVLGHFHVERQWTLDTGGSVYVLPEWKGSRRHLLADAAGLRFVDSPTVS